MACRNHSIKVSDETWAAWAAHAAFLGTSVTKMLVQSVKDSQEFRSGNPVRASAPVDRAVPSLAPEGRKKPSEPKAGSMAAYRKKMGLPE